MSDLSPSHKFDFEVPATQEEAIPLQNSPCKTPTQGASREIPIQGASREKTPSSVDLESMSDDDGDLGYVDIDDFVQLQTRFDALSKSHDHLNQNVTMLTELLTNFIKINSPPEKRVMWDMHTGLHGHLCMRVHLRWFRHHMHCLHMRLRHRMLLPHMQLHSRLLLPLMHKACKACKAHT